MRSPSLTRLLALAVVAAALLGCDVLRAARGCGFIPLDASVAPPAIQTAAPIAAAEREGRAKEVMALRFGLRVEEVVIRERMAQTLPGGLTVEGFKAYAIDGSYLGPIFLDAGGAPVSESAMDLARAIDEVRLRGKVEAGLSDAVARTLPQGEVPVMFQLVAPPWDGPPTPWPRDLSGDAWNAFVERHADAFYAPRVAPFVAHLRAIGARDIAPDPTRGDLVKAAWVFARVPAEQVCDVVRRSEVLRAGHNPPIFLN